MKVGRKGPKPKPPRKFTPSKHVRRFGEIVDSDDPPTEEEIRRILQNTFDIEIGGFHSEQRAAERSISDPEVYQVIDKGTIGQIRKNERGNWQFSFDAMVAGRLLRVGISLDGEKARPVVNTRIERRVLKHGKSY
jgi:hypothetical protein